MSESEYTEKPTGFDKTVFSCKFIPLAFFEELKSAYGGEGECFVKNFRVFALDVQKVGFVGAIGLVAHKENSTLVVWCGKDDEIEYSCGSENLFLLSSYINPLGKIVSEGKGDPSRHQLFLRMFSGEYVPIDSDFCPFVSYLMERVVEMVRKKSFISGKTFQRR